MDRGFASPVGRVFVLLVCVALLFQFGMIMVHPVSPGKDSQSGELPSTIGADGPEPMESVSYLSDNIWIPQGGHFYLKYDSVSQSIVEMRKPNPIAGMPPVFAAAIDRSPDWLKDNITRKFEQLVDTDIDVGSRSTPEFADLDGDGDLDLIAGNSNGYLDYYENLDPALHYMEAHDVFVGAVFKHNISMFLGISYIGRVDPAVGDINNDGLLDLLIGTQSGEVYFIENQGSVNQPSWAVGIALPNVTAASGAASIDVEDLRGDDYPDIIMGEANGTLHFYDNLMGSFTETPVGLEWTDVGDNAAPCFADMDDDGDFDLTVGDNLGTVTYLRNDTTNWTEDAMMYMFIDLPADAAPALFDLNLDYIPDMVLGENNGMIHFYQNIGSASQSRWLLYDSQGTNFNYANHGRFYSDNSSVYLRERSVPARAIEFADIIVNAPQKMVDEIVFSISHSGRATLMHGSTWADVWLNNTEALYYNDAYLDYANIVDYGLGTPDQFSTVEYWVKEDDCCNLSRYEYPPWIYYWYIVHPKGSDELPTFLDPSVVNSGHLGASPRPPAGNGTFWRWSVFNQADTSWPDDSALSYKYPVEENPPLLKERISGIKYLWDGVRYNAPGIFHNNGTTIRDGNGDPVRPWTKDTHAVEVTSRWVETTLALNAQEHNDGNRPRQIARIQFEHNGNCGELSDLTLGAMRATLIPYIEVLGIAGDHCWGAFYERGWHQIDNYWSAGGSVIANWDNYHYGWNRDWGSFITYRGDGAMEAPFPINETHKIYDHNGNGGNDRGNVTVRVTDWNGNPIDGVRVSLADWNKMGLFGTSFGGAWIYTDGNGIAYFTTSESRQNSMGDNLYNEGLLIHMNSRYGEETWNPTYPNRLIINVPGINNESMYYVNWTTPYNKSRPAPLLSSGPPLPSDVHRIRVKYDVVVGLQHPANGFGMDDSTVLSGLFHDEEIFTGIHLDAFIVNRTEYEEFLKGYPFEGYALNVDTQSSLLEFDVPPTIEDWYVVFSNRDSVETSKLVSIEATIQDLSRPSDTQVLPPGAMTAQLAGAKKDHIRLSWGLSGDDGAGEMDVVRYDIYHSTEYQSAGAGYEKLTSVGPGVFVYDVPRMGADHLPHFFYVRAVDDEFNEEPAPNQAAKVAIQVCYGMQLVSSILDAPGENLATVFNTLPFDKVWVYDGTNSANPWTSSTPGKTINDYDMATPVDRATAYWIHFEQDGLLRIIGTVAETTNIQLRAGWNLVGYPSIRTDYTVADLKTDTGATHVEASNYSNPIYHLMRLSDIEALVPGQGYWIYVPSDTVWIVNF